MSSTQARNNREKLGSIRDLLEKWRKTYNTMTYEMNNKSLALSLETRDAIKKGADDLRRRMDQLAAALNDPEM